MKTLAAFFALIMVASGHPVESHESNPLDDCVLALTFKEGPGAKDWSVDQRVIQSYFAGGTNSPRFIKGAFGLGGNAYAFSAYQQMDTVDNIKFATTESFTISLWARPDSVADSAAPKCLIDRNPPVFALAQLLQWPTGDDLYFRIRGDSGSLCAITRSAVLTAGVWHHVVCERNVGANTIQMWVNLIPGTPVTDATGAAITCQPRFGTDAKTESSVTYEGQLADIFFWRRLLTSEERRWLHIQRRSKIP